jgi:hypothetical protein
MENIKKRMRREYLKGKFSVKNKHFSHLSFGLPRETV